MTEGEEKVLVEKTFCLCTPASSSPPMLRLHDRSSSKCNGNISSKKVLENEEVDIDAWGIHFSLKPYLGKLKWTETLFNLNDKICIHFIAWTYLNLKANSETR